jgi:DNA-binding SARP family transcriptional activator
MRAHTVGSFAVYSQTTGEEVTPRGRKARALLAYLLSDPGTKTSKTRLSSLLWGDRGEKQARASLRQALLELRRALNRTHKILFADLEHVWVSAERTIECDSVSAGRTKDDFEDLDDITPEFDDWLVSERARRSSIRIARLKAEAESLLASGLSSESFPVIEQIRILDAYNEDALRLGMEADFQQARPAAIAQRFNALAQGLKDELGVEPSSDSRALRDRFLSDAAAPVAWAESKCGALHEAAERMLQMGAFECNLATNELHWTRGTFALFGIPEGSSIRRDEILDQYEEGSRERLETARSKAIRDGSSFSLEVDIIRRDGAASRLRIDAEVESRNGSSVRIFGTKRKVWTGAA